MMIFALVALLMTNTYTSNIQGMIQMSLAQSSVAQSGCVDRCGQTGTGTPICLDAKRQVQVDIGLCDALPDLINLPIVCPPCAGDAPPVTAGVPMDARCPVVAGYTCEPGVAYNGATQILAVKGGVTNPKTCTDLCSADPNCEFLNYSSVNRECYLMRGKNPAPAATGLTYQSSYTKLPGILPPPANASSVTGDKRCLSIAGFSCEPGVIYNGATELLRAENVAVPDTCSSLCSKDPNCEFFTHHQDRQTCYMKRGKGTLASSGGLYDSSYTKLGAVTAPQSGCTSISGYTCEPGVIYSGTVETSRITSGVLDPRKCTAACSADPNCEFFSYSSVNGSCYMKQGRADVVRAGGIGEGTYVKL